MDRELELAKRKFEQQTKEWNKAFRAYKDGNLSTEAFLRALKLWGKVVDDYIKLEQQLKSEGSKQSDGDQFRSPAA